MGHPIEEARQIGVFLLALEMLRGEECPLDVALRVAMEEAKVAGDGYLSRSTCVRWWGRSFCRGGSQGMLPLLDALDEDEEAS